MPAIRTSSVCQVSVRCSSQRYEQGYGRVGAQGPVWIHGFAATSGGWGRQVGTHARRGLQWGYLPRQSEGTHLRPLAYLPIRQPNRQQSVSPTDNSQSVKSSSNKDTPDNQQLCTSEPTVAILQSASPTKAVIQSGRLAVRQSAGTHHRAHHCTEIICTPNLPDQQTTVSQSVKPSGSQAVSKTLSQSVRRSVSQMRRSHATSGYVPLSPSQRSSNLPVQQTTVSQSVNQSDSQSIIHSVS